MESRLPSPRNFARHAARERHGDFQSRRQCPHKFWLPVKG